MTVRKRKIDEVANDIDEASTAVEEMQINPEHDADTASKLDELHDALEHASDALDDIENSGDTDEKVPGS